MMKKTLSTLGLLALASCSQQPAAAPPPPPPPPPPVAPAPMATMPAPAAEAPKPPPATGAERAKGFSECWAAWSAKDWAKFGACYAENATSEQVDSGMAPLVGRKEIVDRTAKMGSEAPDQTGELELVLVNGNNVAAVGLVKGTNTGPLMSPGGELPATKKKFGLLMGHAVELTEDGRAVAHDRQYFDAGTFLGQLGLVKMPHRKVLEKGAAEKPVVVATGSDAEKANLAAAAKTLEAFNKHDVPGLVGMLADDVVFSDVSAPADRVGKKAVEKSYKDMFKAFSDLKLEVARAWPAGDYLVWEGSFVGTNDGAMPSMGINKPTGKKVSARYLEIDKLVNGKVKDMWIFDNGMAFAMQLGLVPPPGAKPAGGAPAPAAQAGAPAAKPGAGPAASAKAAAPAPTAAQAPMRKPVAAAPAEPQVPMMKPGAAAPTAPAAGTAAPAPKK